ncbi:MAG: hypothetical protein HY078_16210 [Elusimicrobia bacterium]|nr:hypothetical protein [Elusimicrobiota bacterium]
MRGPILAAALPLLAAASYAGDGSVAFDAPLAKEAALRVAGTLSPEPASVASRPVRPERKSRAWTLDDARQERTRNAERAIDRDALQGRWKLTALVNASSPREGVRNVVRGVVPPSYTSVPSELRISKTDVDWAVRVSGAGRPENTWSIASRSTRGSTEEQIDGWHVAGLESIQYRWPWGLTTLSYRCTPGDGASLACSVAETAGFDTFRWLPTYTKLDE